MAVRERTLSEFLQHSGRVLAEIGEGEVVLHRRDGEDLVVMTKGQRDALATVLKAAFALTSTNDHALAGVVLPWLVFLSEADRATCLRELRDVSALALGTGRLSDLQDVLHGWEAAGLAAWDERRNRERQGAAVDDPIDLSRPT